MTLLPFERARAALASTDWPRALDLPGGIEELEGELVWLPFDLATGRVRLDPLTHPELSQVRLPVDTLLCVGPAAAPPPPDQRLLEPTPGGASRHLPFWHLRTRPAQASAAARAGWAAVDAASGQIVAGDLPAASLAARLRLGFWTLVTLLVVSAGGALLFLLSALIISGARFASGARTGAAGLTVALGLMALLIWRLGRRVGSHLLVALLPGRRLPAFLREPVRRAAGGRVVYPLDREWLVLLRVTGMLLLLIGVLQALSVAQSALLRFPVTPLPGVLTCVLGLAFGALWVARSRGRWLPRGPSRSEIETKGEPAAAADLVITAIRVTAWIFLGLLAAGLLRAIAPAARSLHSPRLLEHGARAGALVGALLAPPSARARLVLIAGFVAQSAGELFLGGWWQLALVAGAVAIAALPLARAGSRGIPSLWSAARSSYLFSLGAVAGRLGGRAIGLFFLGPTGLLLGELLGDRIGSAWMLLGGRRQP